jgi:hypothetical protein
MEQLFERNSTGPHRQCKLSLRNKVNALLINPDGEKVDHTPAGTIYQLVSIPQPKGAVGRPKSRYVMKEHYDAATMVLIQYAPAKDVVVKPTKKGKKGRKAKVTTATLVAVQDATPAVAPVTPAQVAVPAAPPAPAPVEVAAPATPAPVEVAAVEVAQAAPAVEAATAPVAPVFA